MWWRTKDYWPIGSDSAAGVWQLLTIRLGELFLNTLGGAVQSMDGSLDFVSCRSQMAQGYIAYFAVGE